MALYRGSPKPEASWGRWALPIFLFQSIVNTKLIKCSMYSLLKSYTQVITTAHVVILLSTRQLLSLSVQQYERPRPYLLLYPGTWVELTSSKESSHSFQFSWALRAALPPTRRRDVCELPVSCSIVMYNVLVNRRVLSTQLRFLIRKLYNTII